MLRLSQTLVRCWHLRRGDVRARAPLLSLAWRSSTPLQQCPSRQLSIPAPKTTRRQPTNSNGVVIYDTTRSDKLRIWGLIAVCVSNMFTTSSLLKRVRSPESEVFVDVIRKDTDDDELQRKQLMVNKMFTSYFLGLLAFVPVMFSALYGARSVKRLTLMPSGLFRVETVIPLLPVRGLRVQSYVDVSPFNLMRREKNVGKRKAKLFLKLPGRRLSFILHSAKVKERELLDRFVPAWTKSSKTWW